MLLKLPIIPSSNSFYFNQLFSVQSILLRISLIYIAMLKITFIYILIT